MPAATRKGVDYSAGIDVPKLPVEGSGNVIVGGLGRDNLVGNSVRGGQDKYEGGPIAAEGSNTVIVNGKPMHRIGDAISDGDVSASGSPNVYVGDMAALPESYSAAATEKIRKIAGRHAPLDDPDSPPVPATFPPDDKAPKETPTVEPVANTPKATVQVQCLGDDVEISDSLKLTDNFTLGSLSTKTHFPHTVRDQAGYTLPEIVCNLKALAENILEPLRQKYPGFNVNSAFRSVTNGKSQHEKGMACDLQWPGMAPADYMPIAKWCVDNLPFDQVIFEHGNSIWLHLSHNRTIPTQRGIVLTMLHGKYEPGLKLYY